MGAPQARLSELGERLIDAGWQVEALTALPNYPTGKIFAGYDRRRPCVEQIGRIRSARTRTAVITNGVDPVRFGKRLADDAARELLGCEPGPIFIFAGLLGHAQGLDQILDIAVSLSADQPGRFVLVGEGPEREHLE